MKHSHAAHLGFSLLVCAGLAGNAQAGGRGPGSLVLYPEFDNRPGTITVFTVTNVNTDETTPNVDTEIVYRGVQLANGAPANCDEFNAQIELSPGDTFTFLTAVHNQDHARGYAYLFAKDGPGQLAPAGPAHPIRYNWLIGHTFFIDGIAVLEYSVNPITYEALGADPADVDDDGDGLLDMNGCEYEQNPDKLLFPRFLGQQGPIPFQSRLVLIDFTGREFTTSVDFLVYNDNEEVFSGEHAFQCWTSVPLPELSRIFLHDFLVLWTNHDPLEVQGLPFIEAGWFTLWGAVSNSTSTTVSNPSVYAVLVDAVALGSFSDLPFETGFRASGALLSTSLDGDDDSAGNCANE